MVAQESVKIYGHGYINQVNGEDASIEDEDISKSVDFGLALADSYGGLYTPPTSKYYRPSSHITGPDHFYGSYGDYLTAPNPRPTASPTLVVSPSPLSRLRSQATDNLAFHAPLDRDTHLRVSILGL